MNKDNILPIRHENPTPIQENYRVQVGMPLMEQLMGKSERSRSATKKILASGRVSINGRLTSSALEPTDIGDLITVHRGAPPRPFTHRALEIIWENDDYIVAYKKRGIPTVNTAHKNRQETALWIISQHYKKTDVGAKVFMINRLDRSTAGFIVFAKNIEGKEALVKSWSKVVSKQLFVACIEGEVIEKEFTLTASSADDSRERGKVTVANIKVDKSSSRGRMHIVRADMTGARIFSLRKVFRDNNFSIFGDVRSNSSFVTEKDIALEQIALEFSLPKSGQKLSFERPYPTHYFQLLKEDK